MLTDRQTNEREQMHLPPPLSEVTKTISVQMKFNMSPFALIIIVSSFLGADQSLGSVCPGLAEPMTRSELAAADQCLKFCDNTPSATTLSTLNNPRNLDLDCSAASFLVQ